MYNKRKSAIQSISLGVFTFLALGALPFVAFEVHTKVVEIGFEEIPARWAMVSFVLGYIALGGGGFFAIGEWLDS